MDDEEIKTLPESSVPEQFTPHSVSGVSTHSSSVAAKGTGWLNFLKNVPPAVTFVLKDSPAEVVAAAGVGIKGRTYTTEYYSKQPGAITARDLVLGTKLACISITDDKEGTLKLVGCTDPSHVNALTIITG